MPVASAVLKSNMTTKLSNLSSQSTRSCGVMETRLAVESRRQQVQIAASCKSWEEQEETCYF
eukprot:1145963-Pelagomonas_calceolata.AAC.7